MSNIEDCHTGKLPLQALQKYVQSHGIAQDAFSPCPRAQAFQAILTAPESAEAWWSFLEGEETSQGKSKSPLKGSTNLLDVYRCAIETIPRQKYYDNNGAFVRVWVGYARQQWRKSSDDARDTFKALRSQHIGDRNALLYYEWASLEATGGSTSKALSVVEKGLRVNAQPEGLLKTLEQELSSNQFSYTPFWVRCPDDSGITTTLGAQQPHTAYTTTSFGGGKTGALSSRAVTEGGKSSSSEDATFTLQSVSFTGRLNSLTKTTPAAAGFRPGSADIVRDAATLPAPQLQMGGGNSILKPRKFGAFGRAVRIASATPDPASTATAADDGGLTGDINTIKEEGSPDDAEVRKRKALELASDLDGKRRTPLAALPLPASKLDLKPPAVGTSSSTADGFTIDFKSRGALTPIPETIAPASGISIPNSVGGTGRRHQIVLGGDVTPQVNIKSVGGGSSAFANIPSSTASKPPRPVALSSSLPCSTPLARADSLTHQDALKRPSSDSAVAASAAAAAAPQQVVLCKDGSISQAYGANDCDMSNEPTAPLVRPSSAHVPAAATPMSTSGAVYARPNSGQKPKLQIDRAGNIAMASQQQPAAAPGARAVVTAATSSKGSNKAGVEGQAPGRRVIEDENSIYVCNICYTKLECVGRGGSSKVYKVMAPNRKIFALKRIRLNGRDMEAAAGFLDEITLLQTLKGKHNIIQLIDAEVHKNEGIIYVVLEYGDIDLARLLQRHVRNTSIANGGKKDGDGPNVDENFIRLYWDQMLLAVDTIHEARIVHSDLKPANFLIVEGQLKLIDFGIAKAIQSDTTSIARESQVGTLNYMSPEAILGGNTHGRGGAPMKVGRASDIWSLGCILYQMVYGHTPFSHLPFIQKMQAIINPNFEISFPPLRNAALVDVMKRCLDRDPKTRITMTELKTHAFLRPTETPQVASTPSNRVELSKEQLQRLLMKVSQATSGSDNIDVEQLFSQLSSGLSPDVIAKKASRTGAHAAGTRDPLYQISNQPVSGVRKSATSNEEALRQGLQRFRFDDDTR